MSTVTHIESVHDTLMHIIEARLLNPMSAALAHQLSSTHSTELANDSSVFTSSLLCMVGPYDHKSCTARGTLNSYLLAATYRDELRRRLAYIILGEVEYVPFSISRRSPHAARVGLATDANASVLSAMVEFRCRYEIDTVNRAIAPYGPFGGCSGQASNAVVSPQLFGYCLAQALSAHGWYRPTSSLLLMIGVIICRLLKTMLMPLAPELGKQSRGDRMLAPLLR